MHAEIEPGLKCPGYLTADRYRHRRGEPTHSWRCSICARRFKRYPGERTYQVFTLSGHMATESNHDT